ncbi:SDR family oxidoreductase [Oceanicoccus sp. KOV_DT_Chl]|uniref:SDR family oxidoreductase n=1 Tax=Oceanicoccus sp. KOV_DT_Chl TaxID=1904639 RepID=UPI000C7E2E0B|nr:SDR family oxidoreductase [Oceanicoccus sp. KOV_DT_Chl]
MAEQHNTFGMSNDEMASRKTVYANDTFAGKRVLISGGGSGIGKASAWLYGRLGANVVICGRTLEKLESAAAAMCDAGLNVTSYPVNIRDPENVELLFETVWEKEGAIDIVVNSAGGQFPQPALDFSPNGWKSVVDTNLNGTWFMMQAAAKKWRDHNRPGNIINMVVVIDRGMWGMAHTCAARAGVIYASKSVAVEWAPLNIRINCIAPGIINTEGMKVYPDEARSHFTRSNAMRRFASPWEIAEACAFLGSDASNFMTGEVITMDGGGHLWGDLWPLGKPEYFKTGD